MSRAPDTLVRQPGIAATHSNPVVLFSSRRDWILGLVLVLAVFLVYQPAMHGGFVWDDDTHISNNETLHSLRGLWEIWFKPGATCQYYPLSFTGFWIGFHLWGLNPPGYHLTNVAMHSLVAILLWQLLARLKVKGAWLAGAIFALHPVCVMSVAWMTELKNTLSAALALASAWAYLRFARLGVYEVGNEASLQPSKSNRNANAKPNRSRPKHQRLDTSHLNAGKLAECGSRTAWWFYALSLMLFQLALFAKTAVSFLPVSLLLATWWRRERLRWRDVWPLIPMLGLAGAMGKLTFYIEHLHGSSGEQFNLGFLDRVLVSGRSFWFYLGKLFFPHQLTFIYERWQVDGQVAWQWLYPITMVLLLGGLWWNRYRIGKAPLAAMLHFFVCTSLLILLVVLYMTRYSFVSDHWQYFGCMSVIALMAAGITAGLERFGNRTPFLKPALCGALLLALGTLTWRQCAMFADSETLWRTTIARNPDSFLAHNNLGLILFEKGDVDEAIAHYQKALEIKPDLAEAHNNLGDILLGKGSVNEAIAHFQSALQIKPYYAEAHANFGNALLKLDRMDEAISHFQMALEIRPDMADFHDDFGKALLKEGSVEEAIFQFQRALAIKPDFTEAQINLAGVLATWPQASLRNGNRAVELAQRANQLAGDGNPAMLGTLAAAYAEAGRIPDAVRTAQRALQLVGTKSNPALADSLQSQLKLYQAGIPYHSAEPAH